MVTVKDFVSFYYDVYVPAYSEMVGYLGDKPAQVLIEMENLSVHLINFIDPAKTRKQQKNNLEKAYNHLLRVTIDCYKLLWVEMVAHIRTIQNTPSLMADLAISEVDFNRAVFIFKEESRRARTIEMMHVGTDPARCLDAYSSAIYLAWELVNLCEPAKTAILAAKDLPSDITGQMPPVDFIPPYRKKLDPSHREFRECIKGTKPSDPKPE